MNISPVLSLDTYSRYSKRINMNIPHFDFYSNSFHKIEPILACAKNWLLMPHTYMHAGIHTDLCMYLSLKCKDCFLNICNIYCRSICHFCVWRFKFFFFIVNVSVFAFFHWGWSGDFSSLYSKKKNLSIYCLLTSFSYLNKRVICCNQNNPHDYFLLHCCWFGVLKSVLLFDSFFLFCSFISCKFFFCDDWT